MNRNKWVRMFVGGAFSLFATLELDCRAVAQTVDVSGQVQVSSSGLVFNRTTYTFDSAVNLTNSLIPITEPIRLVLKSLLPTNVALANSSGSTAGGEPYINIGTPGASLAPGATAPTAILKFNNPNSTPFTFQTQVFASVQPIVGRVVNLVEIADGGHLQW
jgi:hypothetical protein